MVSSPVKHAFGREESPLEKTMQFQRQYVIEKQGARLCKQQNWGFLVLIIVPIPASEDSRSETRVARYSIYSAWAPPLNLLYE
jgi:hypothetical protein